MTNILDASRGYDDSYFTELTHNKDVDYTYIFADGVTQTAPGKIWFFNLILWRPLVKRNIPITSKFYYDGSPLTQGKLVDIQNGLVEEILAIYPGTEDSVMMDLQLDVIDGICNYAVTKLGNDYRSISFYDIENFLSIPEIAEKVVVDLDNAMEIGIHAVEKELSETYDAALKAFGDPKYKDINPLYPYVKQGMLNKTQLAQVLVAAGTRADVSDQTIGYPIIDSYFDGLTSAMQYLVDMRAALKSELINIIYLPRNQYGNRKLQLLTSSIHHIYPGDCGSTTLLPYHIHAGTYKSCIGKFIVDDGNLVELTKFNIKNYVNKVVNFRSVICCEHTNGFCNVCGGRLSYNLPVGAVIGIQAAQDTISPQGQKMLSGRHWTQSDSITYALPQLLSAMMTIVSNEIYFKRNINTKHMSICVPYEAIKRLATDLVHITDMKSANESVLSTIYEMMIVNRSTGDQIVPPTKMIDPYCIVPYFSAEMLQYIKTGDNVISTDHDVAWISLENFDSKLPFMRYPIVNNSVKIYAEQLKKWLSEGITKYKSATNALKEFADLVLPNSPDINIYMLEVIIRAYMVTQNGTNFNIPRVTDPNNVQFGSLARIIPNRSIGAMFAFEKVPAYLMNGPGPYIDPKPVGVFDEYLGFLD